LKKVDAKDVERLKRREKGSYLNYLNAEKVGILISTKPGQQRLKKALELKKKLKDKKSYLFMANNLDTNEFENFGLKSWINTACPRIDLDNTSVINIGKIKG
jgi:diphthamide biosynthesis enzyme Dph1/Dph2-like protein